MRRLTDGLSFSSFLCHSDFRSFLLVSASYSYCITPHSFIPGLKPFLLQILPTVASFFFFGTDSTDSTKSPLSILSVLPHPLISSYPSATLQRSSDSIYQLWIPVRWKIRSCSSGTCNGNLLPWPTSGYGLQSRRRDLVDDSCKAFQFADCVIKRAEFPCLDHDDLTLL